MRVKPSGFWKWATFDRYLAKQVSAYFGKSDHLPAKPAK